MADVKWIKMDIDIFNNRKIRQIEILPDGDSIIVIWVKLLCLAGNINDGGRIYLTQEIPYTDQMLATQFNRPLATIQLALQTFQQFGMLEVVDNILHISNWEKYQNVDRLNELREYNRIAQQKHRAKLKIEQVGNDVNDMSMTSQRCHETDKIREDKNREEKIRVDKSRGEEISSSGQDTQQSTSKKKKSTFVPPTLDEVKEFIWEKGYSVNAEKWFYYYESNGWMVGKNKMKSWRACIAQWNARDSVDDQKKSQKTEIDWSKV